MFFWLDDASKVENPKNSTSLMNKFKTRRRIAHLDTSNYEYKFSVTSQFFLALALSSEKDTIITLSILQKDILKELMENIAVHFQEVKGIYINETLDSIILSHVNTKSSLLFNKNNEEDLIHPIIKNLFFFANSSKDLKYEVSKKLFKINKSRIDPFKTESFENTWRVIEKCFSDENELVIRPKHWVLDDELKNSIALRYFSTVASNVYLWVNEDTLDVLYLHLVF